MLPPLIPLYVTLAQIDQIVSKSQFLPTNPIFLSEKKKKENPRLKFPPSPSPDGDAYFQRSLCKMTPGCRHHNYVRSEKRKEIFIPCRLFTVPSITLWNSMKSAIHRQRLDRMVITSQITAHHTTHHTTSHHTTHHTHHHSTQHTTPQFTHITLHHAKLKHTLHKLHHTKVHHTRLHHTTPNYSTHHTTLHHAIYHTTQHHTPHHTPN